MAEPCVHFRKCDDIPCSKCPSYSRSSCEGSKAGTGNKPTFYRLDVLILASKERPLPLSYSLHLGGPAALLPTEGMVSPSASSMLRT